jgi:hypothetical protein
MSAFSCADLDAALRSEDAAMLAIAREHAEGCPDCRDALEAWDAISAVAPSMRADWEAPGLWARIERDLRREDAARGRRIANMPAAWLTIAAALLAGLTALLVVARGFKAVAPSLASPEAAASPLDLKEEQRRLLTEQTLREVERAEADYVASIDRLAKVAAPLLEQPSTPLLVNYREKLQLLDAAIADCRAQLERNRWNANLRQELLGAYQEKERTLHELLNERT